MKSLKQRYSMWYNRKHNRVGTLWSERFKSVLVEGEVAALQIVAGYIDLNPVRAGIVDDPKDYRWSSYGEAVAGSARARSGLIAAVEGKRFREMRMKSKSKIKPKRRRVTEPDWKSAHGGSGWAVAHRGSGWAVAHREYRIYLYCKGSTPSPGRDAGGRTLPETAWRRELKRGGEIPVSQALRCRVRYFTDGAVIGSKQYVGQVFESHREFFGARRKTGPRKMKGSKWDGLCTIRDLRREIFPNPMK
jgi:hypothetical protein